MLRNAWAHVEALQTTELPNLCDHIARVLQGALDHPLVVKEQARAGDLHQRQEVMVFYYLADIMKHLDSLHEDR